MLDVNVLIALIDVAHVHHEVAHEWFEREGANAWATCPLTENGVLRIVGGHRYPKGPGSPAAVVPSLLGLRSLPGHQFWPDDVSLLEGGVCDPRRLFRSDQIADTYLLALATAHGGRLATLDRRMMTDAIKGAAGRLRLVR